MVEIEAKIVKSHEVYIIFCLMNSSNCVEVFSLLPAFRGFIEMTSRLPDEGYPVLLLVHDPKEMQKDYKRENMLGQHTSRLQGLKPMIHFLSEGSELSLRNGQYLKSLYNHEKLYRELRREYEVMDNNIWNFLVPSVNPEDKILANGVPSKEYLLRAALEAIYDNYDCGLYQLDVAYEYANWASRLFQQSFLNGTHAGDVSPHVFHSESAISLLRKKELPDDLLLKFKGSDVKWRFLLVDDYAEKKMQLKAFVHEDSTNETIKKSGLLKLLNNVNLPEAPPSQEASSGKVSKGDIIKILLEKHGFSVVSRQWNDSEISKSPSDVDILIEFAENLNEAKNALKSKKYDIILLDYLLDEDKTNNIRNYGYELLEDIKTNEEENTDKSKKYCIGPSGQMFFIFMSAFSSAVQGRLLAQGLNQSEKYWYIDIGACPTNTPQLFTYNLLQLMEKRLDDSGIWRLSSDEVLNVIIKIFKPVKMLLNDTRTVRVRARDNYHEVLDLYDDFLKMLKDVEVPGDYETNKGSLFNISGSVLASHFMLRNQKLGGLLEHLVHLVHLTAFGTIRQWAEMWEEYIYIRAYFEERGFNITKSGEFKNACEHIEKYIFDLKSQQR